MPLIHPFTHTFTLTHQRRLAAMQGTNQLVRSNRGLGVLLRDTSTRPGWDQTGNPSDCQTTALPPEPHRPHICNDFNCAYVFPCVRACFRAYVFPCVRACFRAYVFPCVRACVRACVFPCVRACLRVSVRACVSERGRWSG